MKKISIKFSDFIDGYYLKKGNSQQGIFTDICNTLDIEYYKKVDKPRIEKGLKMLLEYNIISNGDTIHNAINESLRTDSDSNTIEIYENTVDNDNLIQIMLNLNNVDKTLESRIRGIVDDNKRDDFGWLGSWLTDNVNNLDIINTDMVKEIGADLRSASYYLRYVVFRDITEMTRSVTNLRISEDYKDILETRIQTYFMRFYVSNIVVRPRVDDMIDITITWSLHIPIQQEEDKKIDIEF